MDEIHKNVWEKQKDDEVLRAYETCQRLLKTPLTLNEFRNVWYCEHSDKSGKDHIANMCMSIFQKRKSTAGSSFEISVNKLHLDNKIKVMNQIHVDSEGNIYKKKPKNVSVHKYDTLIPFGESQNIKDMLVISVKRTLRERWRQDLDSINICKKVIYITKEIPEKGAIDTIIGYNVILVYPNASDSENVWSYEKYISCIKNFQQTGSYNRS